MCDILYPCDTGAQASTSYASTFNQLQQNMSSFIQSNSQETASSTMNINTATINVKGNVDGNIDLTQRIDLTKEVSGKMSQESLDQLKTMMDTSLKTSSTRRRKRLHRPVVVQRQPKIMSV